MPTYREKFQASGNAREWEKVTLTECFTFACDYALLQFQSEMLPNVLPGQPIDPLSGLDANAQMQGARRVIKILQTLSEPVTPPTQTKRQTPHYG